MKINNNYFFIKNLKIIIFFSFLIFIYFIPFFIFSYIININPILKKYFFFLNEVQKETLLLFTSNKKLPKWFEIFGFVYLGFLFFILFLILLLLYLFILYKIKNNIYFIKKIIIIIFFFIFLFLILSWFSFYYSEYKYSFIIEWCKSICGNCINNENIIKNINNILPNNLKNIDFIKDILYFLSIRPITHGSNNLYSFQWIDIKNLWFMSSIQIFLIFLTLFFYIFKLYELFKENIIFINNKNDYFFNNLNIKKNNNNIENNKKNFIKKIFSFFLIKNILSVYLWIFISFFLFFIPNLIYIFLIKNKNFFFFNFLQYSYFYPYLIKKNIIMNNFENIHNNYFNNLYYKIMLSNNVPGSLFFISDLPLIFYFLTFSILFIFFIFFIKKIFLSKIQFVFLYLIYFIFLILTLFIFLFSQILLNNLVDFWNNQDIIFNENIMYNIFNLNKINYLLMNNNKLIFLFSFFIFFIFIFFVIILIRYLKIQKINNNGNYKYK